ncbi:MAG: hypothetical protein KKE57_07950 [Proteobacteria bacterium]|nr:hypothetical protein [Pseudomonadota bacterium]
MARFIHCHPRLTKYDFHVYSDLDFWDARKLLKDLALVKRNFGDSPSGDEYPAQVVGIDLGRSVKKEIEKRLKRAIVSPPRHAVVDALLTRGYMEFDPLAYYPSRWPPSRMLHFTIHRLPLENAALNSPYKTVNISWRDGKIRVERVQREKKYDPVIRSKKDALRRIRGPGCF